MKIKPNLKILPLIIILLSIFLLKSFESQFQHSQKLLVLESNNLLSSHYIQASENMNTIWRQSATSEDKFWIFGMIEKNSAEQIIAFYATDYEKVIFPLKIGRKFTAKDSCEALVGMGIKTYMVNGEEFLDYDNVQYHVVGKLGIVEDSPLKNVILLNNSEMLEQPDIPLMFDGIDLDDINWLNGKNTGNKGVDRWFDVTFISNWISYMTWLVILCASVLAMYYYLVVTKESRNIRFEIGIGVMAIFRKSLWYITLVIFIVLSAIKFTIVGHKQFLVFTISNVVIYVVLIMSYSFLFWRQITKEIMSYV